MFHQIWLIGGTTESVDLAWALQAHQVPSLITVCSSSAQRLYPQSSWLTVRTCSLTDRTLGDFIHSHRIAVILDASHPHATEISRLAMLAATQFTLPYLRFERPPTLPNPSHATHEEVEISHLSQLFRRADLLNQRVLLTIGSKWLHYFKDWHQKSTLFARVLPTLSAIQAAEQSGFQCDRIIALRPPISFELEQALWQQWQISVVVTKASGQPGGEGIKRCVAQTLGVTLIVIKRPVLAYPQQTSDVDTAVQFCQTALSQRPVV